MSKTTTSSILPITDVSGTPTTISITDSSGVTTTDIFSGGLLTSGGTSSPYLSYPYTISSVNSNWSIKMTDYYTDADGYIHYGLEDIYKAVSKKYFEKQMKEIIDEG